jgi:hypothetical protein
MKSLILVTIGLLSVPTGVLAESWKRTDNEAKIIANKINELEDSIQKIAEAEGDDDVSKRDELREKVIMAEIELVDALQSILYHAHISSDQTRYMQRVSKNVSASQLEALQKILDTLAKNSSWMTDAHAMDHIEKESEKLARGEILALREKFQNHADKGVAALIRTSSFN